MTLFPSRRTPRLLAAAAALVAAPLGAQQPAGAPPVSPTAAPAAPARVALPATTPATGTEHAVSLDEALRLAERGSETVRAAAAGVSRATGQFLQARSQFFPQLSGSASYTRTLKTQFSVLQGAPADTTTPITGPDSVANPLCTPFYLRPEATAAERQQALALAQTCVGSSGAGGIDFSRVGFGAANQFSFGLAFSQNLLLDGRARAQTAAASAGRRTAEVELTAQRAQLAYDVTQAYYDAVLSDRLVSIAESTLVQSEAVYRQASLQRQVGSQSEFELLRAQVTRDNQVPLVIQNRTQRDLARLRLKQLVNLPLQDSLRLTTELQDADAAPAVRLTADGRTAASAPDTSTEDRAAVRQALETLRLQEANRQIARADYIPQLVLSSSYGRVAFPPNGVPTSLNQFATNWTVTVGAQVPLFTGGRLKGQSLVARANVDEARARLDQAREFAGLDARQTLAEVQNAEAAWRASAGTAQQANRAYSIAQVRYNEGISTQIELTDSRILLQNSLANRALAARNLQVARVRLALLRDLPLGASSGTQQGTSTGAQGAGSAQQGTIQQSPQTQTQTGTGGVQATQASASQTGNFGSTNP